MQVSSSFLDSPASSCADFMQQLEDPAKLPLVTIAFCSLSKLNSGIDMPASAALRRPSYRSVDCMCQAAFSLSVISLWNPCSTWTALMSSLLECLRLQAVHMSLQLNRICKQLPRSCNLHTRLCQPHPLSVAQPRLAPRPQLLLLLPVWSFSTCSQHGLSTWTTKAAFSADLPH